MDVVDNCPVNAALRPICARIDNGKHVFSEKPLTIELHEAGELLAAASKAGVQHGVIQNMRFSPGARKAQQLIGAGLLGRIFSTNVLFGYMVPQTVLNRPTWFYKKEEAGGGIVEDMMAHFDLAAHADRTYRRRLRATGQAWQTRATSLTVLRVQGRGRGLRQREHSLCQWRRR